MQNRPPEGHDQVPGRNLDTNHSLVSSHFDEAGHRYPPRISLLGGSSKTNVSHRFESGATHQILG